MVVALKTQSTQRCNSLARLGISRESRVIVIGMGVTGLSVLRYLLQRDISPVIVDSRPQPPLLEQLLNGELPHWPQLEITTGSQAFDQLDQATHLIVSPGVSLATSQIQAAKAAGAKILSDIDLFAVEATAPVIAITGSNGKTTVTSLVGKMLDHAGQSVAVGGNIGTPALDLLAQHDVDCYVLELSSFQLEITRQLQPKAAVVLNISPDHMDRYDQIEEYAQAKRAIYNDANLVIENYCDPVLPINTQTDQSNSNHLFFGLTHDVACQYRLSLNDREAWLHVNNKPLMPVSEIAMQGQHNLANALAALALVSAVGIQPESVIAVLREFSGLPHRMELVCEQHGVVWINDSKATNVGACQAALHSMDNEVILIAGGDAKDADFSELSLSIVEKVSDLILLGKDADRLHSVFDKLANIHRVNTIEDAVGVAADLARPGDTVLLSPACASLDQFKNYQARGDAFKQAVMRLST